MIFLSAHQPVQSAGDLLRLPRVGPAPRIRPWLPALAALAACMMLVGGVHAADDPDADDAPAISGKVPGRVSAAGTGIRWGAESLRAEAAYLPDHPRATSTLSLRGQWFVTMKASPTLEWRVGLRTDLDTRNGTAGQDEDSEVAWGDTWLRWRGGDARITAGLQTVLWGRVDAVSLIDRVSRVDLRRFALDDLKERRLPQPSLRWEHEWGSYSSDLVVLTAFQPTLMPERQSPWHPIDRTAAQIIGTRPLPTLSTFFQTAPLQQTRHDFGGAALRLTQAGDGFDHGFTLGRTRQSLPFFQIDLAGGRFLATQPFVRHVAADAEFVRGGVTWRAEVSRSWDVPMTNLSGAMLRARATEIAAGAEFFPGQRETRINLQMLMRDVDTNRQQTVELRRYASLSGEIESSFDQGRWKTALRFASALNIHDVYLSPRVAYLGWEPHEIYLAAHVFRGEQRAYGGFFKGSDALALGVKTRF